ncbi:MAG TPA: hypothetical protein VK890_07755, partial [Bacteroidia bacterium]|nr:hypothetical protein [Bacteroidia bacterium]
MSYGLKYTLTFRDSTVISNKLWKLGIYANGWSGSTTSVTCADSPVQLSYKRSSLITAVCGSELTVALIATTTGQFDEFKTAAPLAYYINVQYSTDNGSTWNTYWNGVNTTDTFSQAHSNAPYPVSLKFNCGLGELQWHRYENAGNLTSGIESIAEVISNCMTFLPYTLDLIEMVNVREDTMSDTAGLFEQLYISDMGITEIGNDGETHGWNCNKLLNAILTSINCRIYQSGNAWFVERIYERIHTSINLFQYHLSSSWASSNTTNHFTSGSLPVGRTINNAGYPKITKTSEDSVTQKQPILTYKFNTSSINNLQLIPSPFFEDTPLNKDSNGRPKRWDVGAGIMSTGGDQLEVVNPFEADAKYQCGYSFGAAVTNANGTYITSTYPYFQVDASYYFNGTTYSLHAVRNSGDTYTLPYLLLDPDNSQLLINIKTYIKFRIQPTFTGTKPTYGQATTLANNILMGYPWAFLPFHCSLRRASDGTMYYLSPQPGGCSQIGGAGAPSWAKSGAGVPQYLVVFAPFSQLNTNFPHQIGKGAPANGGITPSQLTNMILSSWVPLLSACNPI